jgi:hypothetical protein
MIHQSVSLISVERKDGASISSCRDEMRSQTASPHCRVARSNGREQMWRPDDRAAQLVTLRPRVLVFFLTAIGTGTGENLALRNENFFILTFFNFILKITYPNKYFQI